MRIRQILAISLTVVAAGCARLGEAPVTPVHPDPTLASPTQPPPAPPTTNTPHTLIGPSSTPPCTETTGTVEARSYAGVAVAEEVPYLAYLPPCYGEQSDGYPVLYLLHGFPYDQNHWVNLDVVRWADESIASGAWPPVLLVMPLQPEPLFRSSDGGPGSYESEFMEGLMPFIDDNYQTDQARRGVAGISRGGVWALEIAFRNPQFFDSVGAVSPALAVNYPRPLYDPFTIVNGSERLPRLILLAAGNEDWAQAETERLSDVLTAHGFDNALLTRPGEHDEATWEALVWDVINFLVTN